MAEHIERKYNCILTGERAMAHRIFRRALKPKPLGVWEILIPFVFVLNIMKDRQSRELFVQNFIFTKQKALEAARDVAGGGIRRKEALSRIENDLHQVLKYDDSNIYSVDISKAQLKEIDLLITHYLKLFDADGDDYTALIVGAYHVKAGFVDFLRQLESAEKTVARAAQSTLGDQADTRALIQIETAVSLERKTETDRIFGTDPGLKNADP